MKLERLGFWMILLGLVVGFGIGYGIGIIAVRADPQVIKETIIVYEEIEVPILYDETGFLPLVFGPTSNKEKPCADIENLIQMRYIFDDEILGPYQVVDCLQHDKNWPVTTYRSQMVYVQGTNLTHFGIVRPTLEDEWLNVLIWQGSIRPYSLNLILIEEQ